MKLRNNMYKNILSILVSDKQDYRSAQNIMLFANIISIYPSKSIYCLAISRLINYFEKNIYSISLIKDVMKEEDEDPEIISTIELLEKSPTITSLAEVNKLKHVLCDYVKYRKILNKKESFLSAVDLIDDDSDDTSISTTVDQVYKLANEIVDGYNSVDVERTANSFDTKNKDGMRTVVAKTIDDRKPDKIIQTRIKALNQLLSPGYMSGSLYVYTGLPGNYKSGILLTGHVDTCLHNEHVKNATNGKIPISMYISMENTMSQTVNRLWSVLFPNASITSYTVDESTDMIESALTSKGFRSVILYYGYREKSTADIAQIIRSYNDDEYEVVILFFDYIKRVRPARTDEAARSTEKGELNAIMNELKTICAQFNIPIVTGHQLNRAAASAVDAIVANGGFNRTDEAIGRSNIGTASTNGAI